MTRERIAEASSLRLISESDTPGDFLVQILSPGQGSSGYYSPEVVESAGNAGVFTEGTHIYLDHPTARENEERPERSVRDLAGSLRETGRWSEEHGAVVAQAHFYSAYAPLISEAMSDLGMSIRAYADVTEGEHDGKRTRIVREIAEVESVDVVTRAGRGGKVLQAIESARTASFTISEATDRNRRDQLSIAIDAANGSDEWWSYVREFDDVARIVYYDAYSRTADTGSTWQQGYDVADDDQSVTLTGDRTEVRPITTYVSVTAEVEEKHTMADQDKDTADVAVLRESAGRVPVLEAAVTEAKQAQRVAEARLNASRLGRQSLRKEHAALPPALVDRIVDMAVEGAQLNEAGALDEVAFKDTLTAAREAEVEYMASLQGSTHTLRGFGSVPLEESKSDASLDYAGTVAAARADIFGGK